MIVLAEVLSYQFKMKFCSFLFFQNQSKTHLRSYANTFNNIKTTMKYHRKLQLIRQLSKRVRTAQVTKLLLEQENLHSSYLQPGTQNGPTYIDEDKENVQVEIQGGQQEQDLAEGDFSVLDYIHTLPPKLRQQFRMNNPQLPDIFFMTRQQKKKYFESINEKFKQKLAKTPQRKSKTKKILRFKNDFEIKPFNEQQKVVNISKSKQVYESYKPDIHFS